MNKWKTSEKANLVFKWIFALNSVKQKFFPVSIVENFKTSYSFFSWIWLWTYNLGGLTTLLSIFSFLIYLFIRLNVSVYILMIYKWSKIRAWYAFWLNINEKQPWKFIVKNCNPIFSGFCLIFLVSLVSRCM